MQTSKTLAINYSDVNATEPRQWEVNIGSGDGLVPTVDRWDMNAGSAWLTQESS